MDNSTYVALSRASALERNLDVTANNIANANTAGFKAEHAVFEAYVERQRHADVEDSVSFVVDGGSFVDLAQGGLEVTGAPLDLAIEGPGWFAYQGPGGRTVYGRDGALAVDGAGRIVTRSGAAILDQGGGAFQIPQGADGLAIARDGTVSDAGGSILGRIGVFAAPDIQSYSRIGNGFFAAPEGAAPALTPAPGAAVVQGVLETSNVNAVAEMTRLIELHRAYEHALKVAETKSDLTGNTLRRLGQDV